MLRHVWQLLRVRRRRKRGCLRFGSSISGCGVRGSVGSVGIHHGQTGESEGKVEWGKSGVGERAEAAIPVSPCALRCKNRTDASCLFKLLFDALVFIRSLDGVADADAGEAVRDILAASARFGAEVLLGMECSAWVRLSSRVAMGSTPQLGSNAQAEAAAAVARGTEKRRARAEVESERARQSARHSQATHHTTPHHSRPAKTRPGNAMQRNASPAKPSSTTQTGPETHTHTHTNTSHQPNPLISPLQIAHQNVKREAV